MFKNLIILVMFFIIFSLMVQKPQNLDIIVKDVATAKNMIVDGADYLHKTFDKEFSVHTDEVFKQEHPEENTAEKKIIDSSWTKIDLTDGKIVEETWFDEK